MAAYRPKLAQIKVAHRDDTRLVIDYHPFAYFAGGAAMALLLVWVGIRSLDSDLKAALIAFGAAAVFFAGFCLLFYRRMTLTLDRDTGRITHAKRTALVRRTATTYPLASFTGAAVQTSRSGDTLMQRAVLQFSDRDPVPLTLAYLSGDSQAEAANAINDWAGTAGRYA